MEKKDKIRLFRKHLKVTQQELADILGISRSAYANVELGISPLVSEHIETLLIKYGFNPIWYLANIGPMIIDTQDMMQFITTAGHINLVQENMSTKINSPVNQTVNSLGSKVESSADIELEIMKVKLNAAHDKISTYEAYIKNLQEMVDMLKNTKK